MCTKIDERRLFGIIKHALRRDLCDLGVPAPQVGAILNWFDPAEEAYLQHVDSWQRSLCAGAFTEDMCEVPRWAVEIGLIRETSWKTYSVLDANPVILGAVHQVAKLLYKWHGIPRKETVMAEVKDRLQHARPVTLDRWEIEGIRRCLSSICPPDLNAVIGRFGPGVTSEGFSSFEKWMRKGYIPDVPPSLFRVNSRDESSFKIDPCGYTKIAEVPKSIKSNRIVSSEPAMRMFAQLAVNDHLDAAMHHVFRGHVSLHDQALHSSLLAEPGMCSIDLSDASDHNSCELVMSVLPQLWPVLAKVRSNYARFPDGDEVLLETFAPMGSGVCFSVMTLVILGILKFACGYPHWKTYGDDVIVHVSDYDYVIDLLSRAGFVVNRQKSSCNLVYREACGRELFGRRDITPCYIRDPLQECSAATIEGICERLQAGFFDTTAQLVAELSQCIRFRTVNKRLQRWEVCVRSLTCAQKLRTLDGYSGLLRWFSVHTQGSNALDRRPEGAVQEVWTRPSWRLRAEQDYPYLSHWLDTSAYCTNSPDEHRHDSSR